MTNNPEGISAETVEAVARAIFGNERSNVNFAWIERKKEAERAILALLESGEVLLVKSLEISFSEIAVAQNLEPATDGELRQWRFVVMSKLLDAGPQSDGAFLLGKILKRLENSEKANADLFKKEPK